MAFFALLDLLRQHQGASLKQVEHKSTKGGGIRHFNNAIGVISSKPQNIETNYTKLNEAPFLYWNGIKDNQRGRRQEAIVSLDVVLPKLPVG